MNGPLELILVGELSFGRNAPEKHKIGSGGRKCERDHRTIGPDGRTTSH